MGAVLAAAMSGYSGLLPAHIVREANGCFGPADTDPPTAVLEGLEDGYERIEAEVVGEGVHEAFHAVLDRLSPAYQG